MKKIATVLSLCSLLLILSSCYRMPGENEFSVVPTTNNPSVTCEKPNSFLPGLGN
ncbi:Uncharacterized protein PRO82_001843 [Candidatus Protochlamydia amoebophila]|uniref:Lipoprotein n=1 Tax=Candidatus Protochlamydia amoebophila TaxID=362787 RepID=A0A0C1H0U2_9BACT|nr:MULTISPECIES: hypothetical protein [Protochlamydia]KIC71379.1 hypothetical protein DB44_DT00140 [Candidatus Protochlamydia amoebophila]MBS4164514.1 Uncharacterized protein [Candidatus Protochlamydia amoebophila]